MSASTGYSSYIGRTSEQIAGAYQFPPFKDYQSGVWNTATNVPAAGNANAITISFTFPVPFSTPPFVMLTYVNNITSINSMINYTYMGSTTTGFSIRVFGITSGANSGTGGTSPMQFNWMAWPA